MHLSLSVAAWNPRISTFRRSRSEVMSTSSGTHMTALSGLIRPKLLTSIKDLPKTYKVGDSGIRSPRISALLRVHLVVGRMMGATNACSLLAYPGCYCAQGLHESSTSVLQIRRHQEDPSRSKNGIPGCPAFRPAPFLTSICNKPL
jgi:hypothetical protein